MVEGKTIYAACRGPNEEIDEMRTNRLLKETKNSKEADLYVVEGHENRNYKMQDILVNSGIKSDKIEVLNNTGSYANFILNLAPISKEYGSNALGIATNPIGLKRFELYFEKLRKESHFDEYLELLGLKTPHELRMGEMEKLEKQSLERDKLFFGNNWINKNLLDNNFERCLKRKNNFRDIINYFSKEDIRSRMARPSKQ